MHIPLTERLWRLERDCSSRAFICRWSSSLATSGDDHDWSTTISIVMTVTTIGDMVTCWISRCFALTCRHACTITIANCLPSTTISVSLHRPTTKANITNLWGKKLRHCLEMSQFTLSLLIACTTAEQIDFEIGLFSQLSDLRDLHLDIDLGLGRKAYRCVSLIDLYLNAKFRSNLTNFLWTDDEYIRRPTNGRTDGHWERLTIESI